MKKILVLMLAAFLCLSVQGQQKKGVVNCSSAYLYSEPDYSSALETQELLGEEVEILETQGTWVKISTPQPYTAWTTARSITMMDDDALEAYGKAPKLTVTALYSKVLREPSGNAAQICDLVFGNVLRDGKEKVRGYRKVILPDSTVGWTPASAFSRIKPLKGDKAIEKAVAFAEGLTGVPYMWGGNTPKGVDCSGLVLISYKSAGIYLPRNACQMFPYGKEVAVPRLQDGSFDLSALRRGDLVFFGKVVTDPSSSSGSRLCHRQDGTAIRITHVALYLGDNRIIQSSYLVRSNSLIPGDPDYYENSFKLVSACRIVE